MSGMRISERSIRRLDCSSCGVSFDHVTGFLHDAAGPYASYFAACHGHPQPEAQIDVVLGTWGIDEAADHVTFACRLRRSGAMIVDATVAIDSDDPIIGRKLGRSAALAHPWLDHFWTVVDFLALEEPAITGHLSEADGSADAP
ncbi:MAG: hypothetical protein PVG27_07630 [Chloroflexota bacterium]|jgi:hypothetical protein